MTNPISERTFLNYYMFFPEEAPTKAEESKHLKNSIILGLCTLGLVHLVMGLVYLCSGRAKHPISEKLEPTAKKASSQTSKMILSEASNSQSFSLEKSMSNSGNKPFATGKISVINTSTSVIGEKNWFGRKEYHNRIELIDGSDWRTNPGDFIVHCKLYDLSKTIVGFPETFVDVALPGSLFYKVENGEIKLKEKGDHIFFLFDGKRIDLTASDLIINSMPLDFRGNLEDVYYKCYVLQEGKSQEPIVISREPGVSPPPNKSYSSPDHLLKLQQTASKEQSLRQVADKVRLKEHLGEEKLNLGLRPKEAAFEISAFHEALKITLEIAGDIDSEEIKAFWLDDHSLFIYAPTIDPLPQGATSYYKVINVKDYPILQNFEKKEVSTMGLKNGVLILQFSTI